MTQPPPISRDAGPIRPEYAAPSLLGTPHRLNWLTFFSHLSGWALATTLLVVPCLFILPRYEAILADFKAAVPTSTRFALGAARLIPRYGIALLPIALTHAYLAATWYPRAGVGARRVYRLLLTFAVCGVFAVVILALFLPMVSLTNTLTAPPPTKP